MMVVCTYVVVSGGGDIYIYIYIYKYSTCV